MQFNSLVKKIKFGQKGLIPVIIQDDQTNQVLMLAYMNSQALKKTLATAQTYFWSRSRKKLWLKGESSGHTQQLKSIYLDCDNDTLLIKVKQKGAACHAGYYSCFFRQVNPQSASLKVIGKKIFDPKKIYP